MADEYITLTSLGTFAGATAAAFAVGATYQRLCQKDPTWIVFLIAEAVTITFSVQGASSDTMLLKIILGIINGCLVFLAAAGANGAGRGAAGGGANVAIGGPLPNRTFLANWF